MRERIDRLTRDGEEALALRRALDLAEQAVRRGQQAGDFLEPRMQELTERLLKGQPEVQIAWQGGYAEAERRRMVLHRPEVEPADGCGFLMIRAEKELSHRDCLGSLLGLGLRREKVGDIIPLANIAYIVVAQEIRDFVASNLMRVGRQEIEADLVETIVDQVAIEPKVITTTVASMRLDAIIAAGFNLSRADAQNLVKAEKVRLNYQETLRAERQVQEGDLISVRGYGRLKLILLAGKSRKDRQRITLEKY